MSKTESISTLLNELNQTVKAKGAAAVITLLRNARSSVSDNEDIQFVILSVCNQLSANMEHLINEQSSGDNNKYAKAFIVFYLRSEFNTPWSTIKAILNHKNQKWLWELANLIKTLKPYLAAQRDYYSHKQQLDQTIKDYKSKKIIHHGK